MSKKIYIALLFLLGISCAVGQEVIVGLQVNEALRVHAEKEIATKRGCDCNRNVEVTSIDLPVFDDFSLSKIYPDTLLWADRDVFINKDFPFMPPNVGAATFDAIDYTGSVYSDAVWFPPFIADRLTSRPIRLDSLLSLERALSPADSLYLSFFYQPQGTGDEPEPWDTLVLEFGVPSGDSVFARMDSITLLADLIMIPGQDTIRMFDTLWAPADLGCNPSVFMINFDPEPIVRGQEITIPCDSVYEPVTSWQKMWFAEGMKLSEFREATGRDFLQVMVPVLDSVWFNPDFQFRFYNYASISDDIIPTWKSNVDQWNIDFVYLNYNRSAGDTTYRKLTFSQRAPSFLNDYQSMPYRQYKNDPTNSIRQQFQMYIANLDKVEHNTAYEYRVNQVAGNYAYRYNGGNCNLSPFYLAGFQQCEGCGAAHACPPVQALFNIDLSTDTASYLIKHYVSDSSDQNTIVDSLIYRQGFYNYFAYDDGTPELGYGLVPAGAELAYQFNVSLPDTLQGVQMYFNKTLNNANEIYFVLKVWNDNNGKPGELIYQQENQKVAWQEGLYHFMPYMLDEPLIVSGTFYVGWEQYTDDNLNIGFDTNNDKHTHIFYNTNDDWYNSSFAGALLIRPIVGSDLVLGNRFSETPQPSGSLLLFPNPASSHVRFTHPDFQADTYADISLLNIYGSELLKVYSNERELNVAGLPSGLYFVRVVINHRSYTAKLLINN